MRLKDKVGILVGAGQTPGESMGLGRATALILSRAGAKLTLVDQNLESAAETAALINKEGGQAICLKGDWTNEEDCRKFAKACVAQWGRIDFLHNNVGIQSGDSDILNLTEEAYDKILKVNLKGCLLSCKAVLPIMREQKAGSIVNISRINAIVNTLMGDFLAVKVSKAGMNALSQGLAMSNAHFGIRVNTILPGIINSPAVLKHLAGKKHMTAPNVYTTLPNSTEEIAELFANVVPMKRLGEGADIANASVFLHSDEASFITGAMLAVDGGQTVKIG